MKRRTLSAVAVGAFIAACSVGACGSFGTASGDPNATPETGADGLAPEAALDDDGQIKNSNADASVDDAPFVIEAGKPDVDAAAPNCFSFANSSTAGFAISGGVKTTATGLSIAIATGSTATATRTFVAPKTIAKSTVTLVGTMKIEANKGWGSSGADFVGVFGQYYGSSNPSNTAAASTSFNLAKGQSNPDLELTTWKAPNVYDGFDRIAGAGNAPLIGTITTEWKPEANVIVKTSGIDATVQANTLAAQVPKSTTFTLVLGGRSNTSNVPNVEMSISELCVSFE